MIAKRDRNEAIFKKVMSGRSYAKVGKEFEISGTRVRQITKKLSRIFGVYGVEVKTIRENYKSSKK